MNFGLLSRPSGKRNLTEEDGNMKIRVRLPNPEDMRFGAFNTDFMSFAIVNFAIFRREETFDFYAFQNP
jgi:hypothetical protein